MSHRNIPIFIPHMGCPNRCVFCNQNTISGCNGFSLSDVRERIRTVLSTIPEGGDTEIAFFGGSFTGIDRTLMCSLLEIAQDFVSEGKVTSIRLSTRPDYIDPEILRILSRYAVRHIELGIQSMSESVLRNARRGHSAETTERACRAIVSSGFSLVGQMMIGLPGSSLSDELFTAEQICAMGAEAARIYPTVVFYQTPLHEMAVRGEYVPLSVEEAVMRSAAVLNVFESHTVPCIRIGLCATEQLTDARSVYAGPNHPALGELVWNAYYYEKCREILAEQHLLGEEILLTVPAREVSKVIGQHRSNLLRLESETGTHVRKVSADERISRIRASL